MTCILADQASTLKHETEIAGTLLARDYKEFGNQPGNGVIEKH